VRFDTLHPVRRWYFLKRFVVEGRNLLQRQWWEPVDPATVRRHIENSWEDGATWAQFVITLKRI
jgi:hypothetical protein